MLRWKGAPGKNRLKLLLFSLIPVMLLLAVAQSCAYVTIHRTMRIWTDSITGQKYYSMRIGHWPWSHRSLTPLNSLDLPDGEFAGLLPKGTCIHVVFAGDSFTFGDGTSGHLTWPTLVGEMTARGIPDRCIRFFNIGVRNSTIDTTIARIREVLPLIDPDVVVLGQYQNDLADLTNPGSPAWVRPTDGDPGNQWGGMLRRAVPGYRISLVRLLTYRAFAFMIAHDIRYDVLGTWSVLEGESKRDLAEELKVIYRDLYQSLVLDLRSRDIDFVTIGIPSKMDVLAKRSPEGAFFADLAEESDVPHLSLMPVLDAARGHMPYYVYDGHLNEFGNRIVARAVRDWLFAADPAPVPRLRLAAPPPGAASGD
jgi:hypothetical protein